MKEFNMRDEEVFVLSKRKIKDNYYVSSEIDDFSVGGRGLKVSAGGRVNLEFGTSVKEWNVGRRTYRINRESRRI